MSARLTLVVCGAPLAARSEELAAELAALGWDVTTVLSPAAQGWRSAAPEERSDQRPAAVLAFPLTFNTANKVAVGIMDTPAAGVLCDALAPGSRSPQSSW